MVSFVVVSVCNSSYAIVVCCVRVCFVCGRLWLRVVCVCAFGVVCVVLCLCFGVYALRFVSAIYEYAL